jgi:hypothetical protein
MIGFGINTSVWLGDVFNQVAVLMLDEVNVSNILTS